MASSSQSVDVLVLGTDFPLPSRRRAGTRCCKHRPPRADPPTAHRALWLAGGGRVTPGGVYGAGLVGAGKSLLVRRLMSVAKTGKLNAPLDYDVMQTVRETVHERPQLGKPTTGVR